MPKRKEGFETRIAWDIAVQVLGGGKDAELELRRRAGSGASQYRDLGVPVYIVREELLKAWQDLTFLNSLDVDKLHSPEAAGIRGPTWEAIKGEAKLLATIYEGQREIPGEAPYEWTRGHLITFAHRIEAHRELAKLRTDAGKELEKGPVRSRPKSKR